MDCITISTFRNLEQQAIRQYNELKMRDNSQKFVNKETFRQENPIIAKAHRVNTKPAYDNTTNKGKLNLYV